MKTFPLSQIVPVAKSLRGEDFVRRAWRADLNAAVISSASDALARAYDETEEAMAILAVEEAADTAADLDKQEAANELIAILDDLVGVQDLLREAQRELDAIPDAAATSVVRMAG